MKLIVTILCIAAAAMATPHRVRRDDNELENKLVNANNQFTAKMFSEVVKENPEKSVVLSAFSVLSPLAQLELAAVGPSQDEIARAIGVPEKDIKDVFSFVSQKLRSIEGVELKTASKIYIPPGYELNDNFAAVSRDVFQSEPKNVDFTKSAETAKEINEWVEEQTNKRIKDLVDPDSLNSDTRAVLVNAIYFKGAWRNKFSKEQTVDRDFHVSKDKVVKIATMFRQGLYKYAESKDLDAKLIEIPYKGNDASLIIILPNQIDGIVALEEKLKDPVLLANATADMFTYDVSLYLPRFKIETTTDLKQVLSQINVKRIFNSADAKLNNLLKGQSDLYISAAKQKAFIEVNEEGAEAAAANAFTARLGLAAPRPSKTFRADHPYLFIIKENEIVLFSGVFQY